MVISSSPTAPVAHDSDVAVLSTGDVRVPIHPPGAVPVPRAEDQSYGAATGEVELRTLVARYASPAGGARIRPDQVIVTPGARQAVLLALSVLPPDRREVLLPTPYWASYPALIRLAGGVPVPVPGVVGDGLPAVAELAARRTPATGCLVINSPRNPDGAVVSAARLRDTVAWAGEHDIQVLFDQVYRGVPVTAEPPPTVAQIDVDLPAHCVLVDGLTKSHALAGIRLGWAIAGGPGHDAMAAVASHLIGGTCRAAQEVAVAALRHGPDTPARVGAALRANLDLAVAGLAGLPGVSCPRPGGGIFLFPDLRGWLAAHAPPEARADLAGWLNTRHRIAVVDGAAFGAPGHIRISFGVPTETLQRGITRLRAALAPAGAP
jgi:aspartate aminotransferase